MSTFFENYEWEEITFRSKRGGYRARHTNDVWFTRSGKSNRPARMHLAHNLTDELCWSDGDRVQLYKISNKVWALKPHKTGLITLKQPKGANIDAPLSFTSAAMCLNFDFDAYGTVFDAWVDDDALFFKARVKK